jgi:lysophospholipase L1-like esterase
MRHGWTRLRIVVALLLLAMFVVVFKMIQIAFFPETVAIMPVSERRKVYLIGDSLTQKSFSVELSGWGAGLSDWYQRSADVINRGFSGYNSFWVSRIVPKIILPKYKYFVLPQQRDDLILAIIFLGANDSVKPGENQYVPLTDFVSNVRQIVEYLKWLHKDMKIILITPPPVDHTKWSSRREGDVQKYAQGVLRLASELNVATVDLWRGPHAISTDDLVDGLHFNENGNRKVLAGVQDSIRSNFPDIIPQASDGTPNLGLHYPHHSAYRGKSATEVLNLIKSWKWSS